MLKMSASCREKVVEDFNLEKEPTPYATEYLSVTAREMVGTHIQHVFLKTKKIVRTKGENILTLWP